MRLIAAILFLTRVPIPGKWNIGPEEIGRSTIFFPIVGAGIGGLQWLIVWALLRITEHRGGQLVAPTLVLAVLLVIVSTWITGGLHLDGLADMSDGFGGMRTREELLQIMRDHRIGSYGAIALILTIVLKCAAIQTVIEHTDGLNYLIVAPMLGRWTVVILAFFLPYARTSEGGLGELLARHIGQLEVFTSTAIAIVLTLALLGWKGMICALLVAALSAGWNAFWCMRRIQGITGDTMGASVEICETLVLVAGSVMSLF